MWEIALAIIGIGVTIGGILIKQFGRISQEMTKLGERVTRVETKVELFWKGIEGNMVSLLKSPTKHRKDALLDKLSCNTLNQAEAIELKDILTKEFNGKKRANPLGMAYVMAIARLDLVLFNLKEGIK